MLQPPQNENTERASRRHFKHRSTCLPPYLSLSFSLSPSAEITKTDLAARHCWVVHLERRVWELFLTIQWISIQVSRRVFLVKIFILILNLREHSEYIVVSTI